jgi:hypothetical protein
MLEEIPHSIVPNPLVSWGIIISTLGAFEDQLKEAKPTLGLRKAHVGVNFPYEEQVFPAVVVGLNGLEVRNMGFYSAELTEPRNQLMKSTGEISIQCYTPNHNTLMTMVDFITQCVLFNLYDKKKMFYPGADRSWIGIGYAGGVVNWSPFQLQTQDWTNESYERLFTSSTSLKFTAEHTLSTELARVSAIDIEAIPLNRIV